MNAPVNFELAKLLKEKGFVEVCEKAYRSGGLLHTPSISGSKLMHSNVLEDGSFSALTIAEVVMWLYEKYNIWITVDVVGDESTYPRFDYRIVHLDNPNSNIEYELERLAATHEELINRSCESPAEAYEKAIEYCLTRLI